jgi:hypothetical protein
MNSITNDACEKEIMKFVTADNTIMFYADDFLEIDTVNSVVSLSKGGVIKISNIEDEKGTFYLCNLNNEWISIDIFEAREARREETPVIVTLKNKLLFYSKNQLVVQGDIWFLIATKANIKIKK